MNEEMDVYETKGTKIKIIGVGGAGGNAINDMIDSDISGVEYIAINTDEQDLKKSKAKTKISLGHLGAGANPEIARESAENNSQDIRKVIKDQDMIFITAGMGGGTGTGASPVIAKIAKEEGILTVAIVTKPFKFEGKKRKLNAEKGLEELKKYVDTLIVIPNQKLLDLEGAKNKNFQEHFKASNEILRYGVKGIAELITKEGTINLDFSDVKSVMQDSGVALFGFVESNEDESIEDIVERTITNPLLEKDIKGASKILVNITSGNNVTMEDVIKMQEIISERASGSDDGVDNLIFGAIYEPERTNVVLSVIATGFEEKEQEEVNVEEGTKDSLFSQDDNTDFVVPPFNM